MQLSKKASMTNKKACSAFAHTHPWEPHGSSGSEINFLIWAPTGEQVLIFGRQRANYGRQKLPLAA